MGASSDTGLTIPSERGQSALLGIVLLIGMVTIGSLGIFFVAGGAISDAEQQSEQEQIEQAFVELSSSISSSTFSSDTTQSMEFHAGERGAIAHHDSATYEIWMESYEGDVTPIADGSIGTIEYEGEDGTKIAYEGGGVFHETGERTHVVSPPPINYDHGTSTLSFSVVGLTEDKTISSGDVQIRQTDSTPGPVNYIQNDNLFVKIESEYCRGWEQYFTGQAGDTTVQESCYDGENDDGTVEVRLGYEDFADAFSSGAALASEDNYEEHQSGGEIDDVSDGEFKPIDDTILQMVDDFEGGETNLDDEAEVDLDSIEGGKYFAGEGSLDDVDELTFNLEDDDATVVIDDDIKEYDITVESCGDGENQVKIYGTGNLDLSADDSVFNQECGDDVSNLQIYGMSTMAINLQNGDFEGLLYAASDKEYGEDGFDGWETESSSNDDPEYQVHVQGSPEFEGSIVAHSIYEGSNFDNFDMHGIDNSEVSVVPQGYEPAPQLTYLNVAEHEIEIRNN